MSYLDPTAFALPATGTFGNVGKNSLRGPNLLTWDTGLFKQFPFASERFQLQFRTAFFNVVNRAKFDNPANSTVPSFSSTGFGTITRAEDPRIGQLVLKLLF